MSDLLFPEIDGELIVSATDTGWLGRMPCRDYQAAAVEGVFACWQRGEHRALTVMATGTGKTVVISETVMRHLLDDDSHRVLVFAHRRELIDQAVAKIARHTGSKPKVEMGDRRVKGTPRVVVSSVQTLNSARRCAACRGEGCGDCINGIRYRFQKWRPGHFSMIVIDEGHHATAASYLRVQRYFAGQLTSDPRRQPLRSLLVTATAKRTDEVGLREVADKVAYELSMKEAIDNGWLVPVRQKFCTITGLELSNLKTHGDDFKDSDIAKAMKGGSVDQEEARAIEIVSTALQEARRPDGTYRSTLFFGADKANARLLCEVAGRFDGVEARCVVEDTPLKDREDAFIDFAAGRLPVLTNCGVATEGFDAPPTAVVVVARPTCSWSLYAQIVGRGTRPLDGLLNGIETAEERKAAIAASDKPECLIIDVVGHSLEHQLMHTGKLLAGEAVPEDVEAAVAAAYESGEAVDMESLIEEAGAERERLEQRRADEQAQREEEERRRREEAAKRCGPTGTASYESQEVDPFAERKQANPAPKGVVDQLVKLGVERSEAEGFGRRQAFAVLRSMQKRKKSKPSRPQSNSRGPASDQQKKVLAKFGLRTDVTYGEAYELITNHQRR